MKGWFIVMNLKKLLNKSSVFVSLATFTLSISLNASAIKPTPEQLKSFYSSFEVAYPTSLTSRYPNIRFLAGLDAIEKRIGEEFSEIVKKLRSPDDFETFEGYLDHLTHYRINAEKLLTLDRQISILCNTVMKETELASPDITPLMEFYGELTEFLSTDDCNEFVVKTQEFIQKWNSHILRTSVSIGASHIDAYTEKFSNARREAQANFESFLRSE